MEGIVTQYDDELNGVVLTERGISVSIPGTIVGEHIRYHIEHTSPHAPKAWGRCDSLLKTSPDRVTPPCKVAWPVCGSCAGCPLMHISDALEQKLKVQMVLNILHKAGIQYIRNLPFTASKQVLNYRNRTDLVVAERNGHLVLGSYKPRSHDIIVTRFCPILRMPINPVLGHIVETANQLQVPANKATTQRAGALRYVSVFANDKGDVLIDLVCKSASGNTPLWLDRFAKQLMSFSAVRGVSFSLNDSPNNAIRIAPSKQLFGVSRLPEHHNKVVSLFSASGFTQLNTEMAALIYQSARQWLGYQPAVVWDLYCGAGAFGRTIAPTKALFGAEFSASAIEAAKEISQNDDFDTHFEVIDLENTWPDHWPNPDVVLVDPPRKGLSKLALQKLLQLKPAVIMYMSCNPESFAQNVANLSDVYVLERIEAFDMMPQTRHVELLGLLKKR